MSNILEFHPIADLFPLMLTEGKEWEEFCNDISTHGLRVPILLHVNGRILDGRNRYRACLETNTMVESENFEGTDEEAVEEVISLNLHRRHLTDAQRAVVAAKIANIQKGWQPKVDARPSGRIGITQGQAAKMLNVSAALHYRNNRPSSDKKGECRQALGKFLLSHGAIEESDLYGIPDFLDKRPRDENGNLLPFVVKKLAGPK